MGLFERANELVILEGARNMEWTDALMTSAPTATSDGDHIDDSITAVVAYDASGTVKLEVWALPVDRDDQDEPGWRQLDELSLSAGDKSLKRYDNVGHIDRIALAVTDGNEADLDKQHLGWAIT